MDAPTSPDASSQTERVAELHARHGAALERFLCPRWPRHFEDLLQEVWAKALQMPPDVPNERAWLFRVARNVGIDRVARKRQAQAFGEGQEAAVHDGRDDGDPLQELLRGERATQLRRCVSHLSEEERLLVVGKLVDGRSHDELAGELGISEANSAKWLFRAKQKLKSCMESALS